MKYPTKERLPKSILSDPTIPTSNGIVILPFHFDSLDKFARSMDHLKKCSTQLRTTQDQQFRRDDENVRHSTDVGNMSLYDYPFEFIFGYFLLKIFFFTFPNDFC